MRLTSMVFLILLGATTFTLVFRTLGGDDYLVELIQSSQLSAMGFLALVMIAMFIAGFFIDFIGFCFRAVFFLFHLGAKCAFLGLSKHSFVAGSNLPHLVHLDLPFPAFFLCEFWQSNFFSSSFLSLPYRVLYTYIIALCR